MNKKLLIALMLVSLLAVTGCDKKEEDPIIGGGSGSGGNETNQNTDTTNDNSSDTTEEDSNSDEEDSANVGEPLKDVRADFGGGYSVVYDSDTGVGVITGDGETTYMDVDGYAYGYEESEGWVKIKFTGSGGFVTDALPELKGLPTGNTNAPDSIPVVSMPYRASYAYINSEYDGKSIKCENGAECTEFNVDGGILRFDNTLRLVEAVLDGEYVLFTHGDYEVNAPAAKTIEVPAMPDMSQFGM